MTAQIRFDLDLDRDSLLELRAQIDRLLEALESPPSPAEPAESNDVDIQELAYRKVDALWARAGLKSRTFLSTCARAWPAGQEFTFQHVAQEAGEPIGSVRSWHRNLSRSLRQVEERYPKPLLLHQRWVEDRNHYWLSPEIQRAILEQHPIKPPGPEGD